MPVVGAIGAPERRILDAEWAERVYLDRAIVHTATTVGSMPTKPLGSMGLLERARSSISRLTPREAFEAQQAGAVLIDLRTEAHRRAAHNIPGALAIDLTVLHWRLDPTFEYRIPEATSWDQPFILMCRHGYSSSIATALLVKMGLTNVADVVGGYDAWEADGFPFTDEAADVRE